MVVHTGLQSTDDVTKTFKNCWLHIKIVIVPYLRLVFCGLQHVSSPTLCRARSHVTALHTYIPAKLSEDYRADPLLNV